ncbi:MAG: hypothetical protein NZV14_19995 [Bryobacteraceae bacterium]|nr:hypothetical protein [Bryobacteraceae bacterium]MDW8380448.1 hypothetical protein [Bryobacterales bacterium]
MSSLKTGLRALALVLPLLRAPAQVIILQPEYCPDAEKAKPISVQEGPFRLSLGTSSKCLAASPKGRTLRIWKYPHHYQRLAAPQRWKIELDNGAGKTASYDLPNQSVIGITLEYPDRDNKWKNYRGSSKNPIALTQPVVTFTVRKQDETKTGGLKQEHLVWDVLTIDPITEPETRGAYPLPSGVSQLRIDEVWVWQGLNPIPKKMRYGTGKGKVVFRTD